MMTMHVSRTVFAALIAMLLCASACFAQTTATINVDAGTIKGPVNHMAFGDQFEAADSMNIAPGEPTYLSLLHTANGIWDDVNLIPDPTVVSAMQNLRIGGLRYPGGELATLYDWHKAVGPLSSRGDWHVGIDEYIQTCRTIGCEPQFIMSIFTGTPQDAADLVQYLNSPADSAHPWAQLRAQCGHTTPYNVHWFEMGNETDTTVAYPNRTLTVQQYALYVNQAAALMKAVDPTIKIGIISGTGKEVEDPWNTQVLQLAGSSADFFDVHMYAVGEETTASPDLTMRGCMASTDQFANWFQRYHALIVKTLGHDLPLSLSEYNGGFDDIPAYRESYGDAMFNADLERELLDPANNIILANCLQGVSTVWGFMIGSGADWEYMPGYPVRALWGEHFGDNLIPTSVNGPKANFEGVGKTNVANGSQLVPPQFVSANILTDQELNDWATPNGMTVSSSNYVSYTVNNVTSNQYPTIANVPSPTASIHTASVYTMTYSIRVTPASGNSGNATVSLGLQDSRGWTQTQSAAMIGAGASADGQWHQFTGTFNALPDAPGLVALIRIEQLIGSFSGTIEIQNITLAATATFPSVVTDQELSDAAASAGMTFATPYNVTYTVSNVTQAQYPGIAVVPTPSACQQIGCMYNASYSIRVTPSAGSGGINASLGLQDDRGFPITHSATKVGSGAPADGQWYQFSGCYAGLPDASEADVLMRIENPSSSFSGTIEMKDILVSASTRQVFPAYDLITSSASLSSDASKLYVIVFNKSTTTDISTSLMFQNATVTSANYWLVNGPNFEATTQGSGGVEEVQSGASTPVTGGNQINFTFPAHSMTAFELAVTGVPSAPTPYNVNAIATVGTAVANRGADTSGSAYASSLLGLSATFNSTTIAYGPANQADAYTGETVNLPQGKYGVLNMLATGLNGPQSAQKFVVNYTDGTTQSNTLSLSDWRASRRFKGETLVSKQASRINSAGQTIFPGANVYGYALGLASSKTIKSITLPSNRNVVAFGFGLK